MRDNGYREVIFIPEILTMYTNFGYSQTKEEKLDIEQEKTAAR